MWVGGSSPRRTRDKQLGMRWQSFEPFVLNQHEARGLYQATVDVSLVFCVEHADIVAV